MVVTGGYHGSVTGDMMGYTVPGTLATQPTPCHLYDKRDTHVTRLALRPLVPQASRLGSAPPWPRVWTLQNVSSAVSCSSPASWSIFSVPLRPRCLWSDSRPRSLRHQGAAGSGGQTLHPANQQNLVSAHSAKTISAPEIISERQQQLQRPGGLHPLHGEQVIMRAADC